MPTMEADDTPGLYGVARDADGRVMRDEHGVVHHPLRFLRVKKVDHDRAEA